MSTEIPVTELNTIAGRWSLVEADLLNQDVGEQQREDLRSMFFLGAIAMLDMHHELSRAGLSDDAGASVIGGWFDEALQFATAARRAQ